MILDILKVVNETRIISEFVSYLDNHTIQHSSIKSNSDLLTKLQATLKWPLLDLEADLKTSAAIGGVRTRLGSKMEYDMESFNRITLYGVLSNPLVISKPMTQDSGLYDLIFSVDSLKFGLNVTATVKNESKRFGYNSFDETSLGVQSTSLLTSFGVVAQNCLNAGTHVLSYLSNNAVGEQQGVTLHAYQNHELVWLLSLGFAILAFHFSFFKRYKQMNLKINRKIQR